MAWRQRLSSNISATDAVADAAPWRQRDTLIGVLLTLVPLMSLSLIDNASAPVSLAKTADASTAIGTLFSIAILEGVFLIAPLYYAQRTGGQMWWQSLGFRRADVRLILGFSLLAMAAVLCIDYIFNAIITVLHLTVQTNADRLEQQLLHLPLTLYATLFGAIFIAPICEEIFFRGFLLQGLRAVMTVPWAVVVSSLIFAAAHADLGSFPLLLVLGLLMGTLRVVTRSIWPGFALHTFNNALTALLLIIQLHK